VWDQFLVWLAIHPFTICGLGLVAGFFVMFSKRESKTMILSGKLAFAMICMLILLLHWKWDSFTIHFSDLDHERVKQSKILFIGDSISCEGTRPKGFITKLESFLSMEMFVLCQKGASTSQIMELVEKNSLKVEPDLIVVQTGINDLLEGKKHEQIILLQNKLLGSIKTKFPKTTVCLLPIHPICIHKRMIASPPSSSSAIQTTWQGFSEKLLLEDGIHLNAMGHTFLACNLIKQFIKISHNNA
tara:strand:+ start:938 stop:1669 length:732 start_codon:yes stop_codon:yes gene_type:complete